MPPVVGSLESLLQAAGMPRYILDLRHRDEDAPEIWFRKPRGLRGIGATARRCSTPPTVAAEEYDGLVWIDPSTPTVLLPFD